MVDGLTDGGSRRRRLLISDLPCDVGSSHEAGCPRLEVAPFPSAAGLLVPRLDVVVVPFTVLVLGSDAVGVLAQWSVVVQGDRIRARTGGSRPKERRVTSGRRERRGQMEIRYGGDRGKGDYETM